MEEHPIGRGHTVRSFSSMEEMNDYLAEQETAAVRESLDEQWKITWGSFVIRFADEIIIFGEILTEEQFLGPNPDEELLAELDDLRASFTSGYRFGRFFSVVIPEGEYGSAHVVSLWEISRDDFLNAQANNWVPSPDLLMRVGNEIVQAQKRAIDG